MTTPNQDRSRSTVKSKTIPSPLTQQCLHLHHPDQKFSKEAVDLTSELLRLFVLEARRRAAIEAECEAGIADYDIEGNSNPPSAGHDTEQSGQKDNRVVLIRPDHIAKIAAELLMDLS
mmetsp:Transcript_22261/g.46809  ORF Transcript_22261/g.46809 Transcript_22261/m.46809 type:complete len:118 (+) Transcript_22261:41-394(+)|eukprot:CAMPEP_0171357742 /NCGR_PEP_ID=MMETSP0878-20121228/46396_1 /TAXON_ID=67004 /ORGANISM="Thalassiosira weissflogii, Strain CCMP1336" /LENGTH=117 /DNA_ID=CAMNT_0011863791 /DNA_START=1 /DNA_END=354 /DNA_ORIENTATION=+